jgi:hypothetical protein
MATDAEKRGIARYDRVGWMTRARLFKGLRDATMNVGSLFADARDLPSDIRRGLLPKSRYAVYLSVEPVIFALWRTARGSGPPLP